MNVFKNYTIMVLSACIGSVIMEEQYHSELGRPDSSDW